MISQSRRGALAKKIKALFAKTREAGCTEDEALNATILAAKLQAEYNIDMTETELLAEGFETIEIVWKNLRLQFIEDRLCVPIANFTSTRTWVVRPHLHGNFRKVNAYKLVFCGLKSDIVFAGWLLEALRDFIYNNAVFYSTFEYIGSTPSADVYKSFVMGACARISERLKHSKYESIVQNATHNALIVLDKQALIIKHLEERGLEFQRNSIRKDFYGSRNAFEEGLKTGGDAGLNRPINATGKTELLK